MFLFSCTLNIPLSAQGGRFEAQKRVAFGYLKDGKFDQAAAKLEEVWDFDKTDPMVAEGLSIAYLNGADRRVNPDVENRAYAMLQKALEDDGKAVFLVIHSHEKFTKLQGHDILNFCAGQFQIRKGKISYVAEKGSGSGQPHSFDLASSDIKEIGEKFSWGRGMFLIKSGSKESYTMAPRSRAERDSQCLLNLVNQYVTASR